MHRHFQAFLPSFIYFSPRVDAFHTPFREYAWRGSFNLKKERYVCPGLFGLFSANE